MSKKSNLPFNCSLSLRYFYFVLSCLIFFFVVEITGNGVRFQDIFSKDVSYLMVVLYTLLPFFLIFALLKMLIPETKEINEKKDEIDENHVTHFEHLTGMENALLKLEKELLTELESYQSKARKNELYGKFASMFSLFIPAISWAQVFLVSLHTGEAPNLGLFGFSSMTTGGLIGVTVGLTLLKQAKTAQKNVDRLEAEVTHLKKLRMLCSSHQEIEKSPLMLKIAEVLMNKNDGKTDEEEDSNPLEAITGSFGDDKK